MDIIEEQKYWEELWLTLAEGKISDYEIIKRADIFEFYTIFEQYKLKHSNNGS